MPPAPLPTLPGVFYCRAEGIAGSRPISNVFTFSVPGMALNDPNDTSFAKTVSDAVAFHWPIHVVPVLNSNYASIQAVTYALGSPLVPAQITAMPAVGGIVTAATAQAVSALASHQVTRRGRGSQSRTFLAPISDEDVASDGLHLTEASQARLNTGINAFINSAVALIAGDIGRPVLYMQLSKFQNKVQVGHVFPINSTTVELALSTQRRRSLRRRTR